MIHGKLFMDDTSVPYKYYFHRDIPGDDKFKMIVQVELDEELQATYTEIGEVNVEPFDCEWCGKELTDQEDTLCNDCDNEAYQHNKDLDDKEGYR